MVSLAGIIHPTAFQVGELIKTMTPALFQSSSPSQLSANQIFRYKNLELAVFGSSFASDERKTKWVSLDGKIHNALKLKSELKNLGYQFSKGTDSELLVHAYDAWGESFLEKLNGTFAFALFDEEKETLILVRDRLGKKNLYWAAAGDYFLFSTEIKGLLSTGIVSQTPAVDGLGAYLYFGFIPQDLSPIKGVMKILPGHYLKVNLKRQSTILQYWSYSRFFEEKSPLSRDEAYHDLGVLLEDALRISIPDKQEVGAVLSTFFGPTSLCWFLSHLCSKQNIDTYTVSFEGTQEKFLKDTDDIADLLGVKHFSKIITPDEVLKDLLKMVWYQDEPIASPSAAKVWHLGLLAKEKTNTLFSAVGWEEMLAGHSRYFIEEKSSYTMKLAKLNPFVRDRLLIPTLSLLGSKYKYRILRNIDINTAQMEFLLRSALFSQDARKKVSPFLFPFFDPEVFTQRFHQLANMKGWVDPFLYFDAKTALPDHMLLQNERLLAPHGIEVVTPFLDHRLVQFLAKMPEELKFEGRTPGIMLKNLMHSLFPNSPELHPKVRERPLFPTYLDSWRKQPKFREIFALLENGLLVQEGYISGKWIRQQLGYPHLIPRAFLQLWSILVLEIWFRLFINRPLGSLSLDTPVIDLLQK